MGKKNNTKGKSKNNKNKKSKDSDMDDGSDDGFAELIGEYSGEEVVDV